MVAWVVDAAHVQPEHLDGEQGVTVETEEEETTALQRVTLGELLSAAPEVNVASIEQHIHVPRIATRIVCLMQVQ